MLLLVLQIDGGGIFSTRGPMVELHSQSTQNGLSKATDLHSAFQALSVCKKIWPSNKIIFMQKWYYIHKYIQAHNKLDCWLFIISKIYSREFGNIAVDSYVWKDFSEVYSQYKTVPT